MLEPPALGLGMILRRARSFAGLAAAIVPFAIIVHLVAEAAATERDGISVGFVLRHAYFAAIFAAAVMWFAVTVGAGRSAAERSRRCALVRADLSAMRGPRRFLMLVAANLAFFSLTQAVEGNPIGSGALMLGLGIALAGSLLSALLVFVLGNSFVTASLESVIGESPFRRVAVAVARRTRRIAAGRHATLAYSLFIPNRPPPTAVRI
jgi:hypothetical protein